MSKGLEHANLLPFLGSSPSQGRRGAARLWWLSVLAPKEALQQGSEETGQDHTHTHATLYSHCRLVSCLSG